MTTYTDRGLSHVLCPDCRNTPCIKKSDNGACTCLSNTRFSAKRKDANGNVLCPFYCSEKPEPVMRCRRSDCPYQIVPGSCSSKEMYTDCPWMRRNARKNYADSPNMDMDEE